MAGVVANPVIEAARPVMAMRLNDLREIVCFAIVLSSP